MKAIAILSASILVIWFVIMQMVPDYVVVSLTNEILEDMKMKANIQKGLWWLSLLLQILLIYKLYRLIPVVENNYKTPVKIYLGIVIISVILSCAIFFIAVTAFWM